MAVSAYETTAGVSRSLAQRRAGQLWDIHYALRLHIPEAMEAPIVGQVVVRFTLQNLAHPVVLDFSVAEPEIDRFLINGVSGDFRVGKRRYGRLLHGDELARIAVVLDVAEGLH